MGYRTLPITLSMQLEKIIKSSSRSLYLSYSSMATHAAMRAPVLTTSHMAASIFNATARRTLTTSARSSKLQSSCARIKLQAPRSSLQQAFRRSYAETLSPPIKRRGRGFFRWTWRLTYLSALGGMGWLGYSIYTLRTPHEQFNPDPSKKTLVILGT